jgi:uncharacterized protein involved in type VI secretion and phage assembly
MSELFNAIETSVRAQATKYYGKFRAFVVDNEDPQRMGRVKLRIPSVLGEIESDWALPCFAYGGGDQYGMIAVPPVDAAVVAEFLEGDASSPMWTGTFWRTGDEVPEEFENPAQKVLRTETGHKIVFDDTADAETITITSKAEAEVLMDAAGSIILTDSAGATVTLDAEAGELTVADANGNELVMTSSGITCTDANGNEITAAGSGVEIKSSATVNIEGSMVTVAGSGGEPLIKGSTFLSLFNAHTHNATSIGAPTSPPIVPLTPSVLTTKSTAS